MRDRVPTLGIACLILALVIIVMYLIATPSPAQEQGICAEHNKLEKNIFDTYGESPIGAGVTPVGILYVTANLKTGTFSVIMRRSDGMACIIGGGKGWASVDAVLPGVDL